MTKTINVTQEILDSLPSGDHTLKVTAMTTSGFSQEARAAFSTVSNPTITVDASQGEHSTGFSFDIVLFGINDNADVKGYIDGQQFYQLNYAIDGTYSVEISDNTLISLGGGEHQITFSLTDAKGKTANATSTFSKLYSLPIVSLASTLGDKTAAFAVPFSIKNAQSEHPSLAAYVDTTVTPIFQTDDASQINSVTVDNEVFSALDNGAHSVIIVVTNDAGSTTKTASFNKTVSDSSYSGLKLGYSDDTWDGSITENRLYEESEVTYLGQTYKSFEDKTPYDTEGEVVTGGLLAAFSRGVQNASSANIQRGADGSYTESSANGTSVLSKTDNGYVEVFTDKEGNTLTKNVTFNEDGVTESTTYTRA